MFGMGVPEIVIVLGIALLIFGPRQLPKMGRALGQTIKEIRGIGKELHGDHDDEED